ncbi:sensor histidine kinase [Microbacterium dauci]|uniref:histidine kinase n=1 Tax=Microbacterium dauci TaxID=3048008 RepID=A0ABT6ZEU8_9MICO|nr:HAMP domain-containing sensor histidine kinase [Microbacterium sp. LX3-4]MDJ1114686.1 HAMP domain-containing sensor histidine kinase [Microbacterium sp. LX3-4]
MDETARRRRRFAVSVRTRIVTAITLVAALGLASVGVTVFFVERGNILRNIDDRLHDNLDSARFIVENGEDGGGTWDAADAALYEVVQRMSPDDNTGALGVIGGRAVMKPGIRLDLDLTSAPGFAAHAAGAVAGSDPVIGSYIEEDVAWRYLAAPIAVEGATAAEETVFVLAYDIDAELAELSDAGTAYLWAAGGALLVVTAVAFIVSTRLLRPLRRMRETAERVSGQSLSERLPIDGRDDVADLAETINAMLDRLDAALDSQRQLLSDVGHELKTPITIVRGNLEVMDPMDPADAATSRDLAVDELDRMAGLVQDLASAASLHGPAPVTKMPVDAGDLMQQVVRKASSIAGATVVAGNIADVVIEADADRLTQALLQLAQNAVTHGGGDIVMGSRIVPGAVEFWVRDHGAGVPDEAKRLVFERFHRGEENGGSGLGLNIVQVIARAHGGSVRVADAAGGGAVFLIAIPHAAAEPDPIDILSPVVAPAPPLPPLVREDA